MVDTVELFPSKTEMPQTSSKDLAIIAAFELSYALLNPAPVAQFIHIGTAQLQALRQISEIFTAALPPTATQHLPPASQASSQFRNTLPPFPVSTLGSPCPAIPSWAPTYLATPSQSSRLARYASPRVRPIQAPSPRVDPGVSPRQGASPMVDPATPHHNISPLTPHHAAPNAP
jgi:hypothetical protein